MARNKPKRKSHLQRQSKRQQTELLKKRSNLTYAEINKLNKKELEKITNISISEQPNKIKQNEIAKAFKRSTGTVVKQKPPRLTKKDYRQEKANYLRKLGFEPFDFTTKQIDSIKISDVRKNKFNTDKYPFLYGFDFYEQYKLPKGKRMYFAYRDYAGETPLEEILTNVKSKSTKDLIGELNRIVNMPMTGKAGKVGTSSGVAGEVSYHCQSQNLIIEFNYQDKRITSRDKRINKKRQKDTTHAGFQVIKNGNRNSFDVVTGRGLLEIGGAMMSNVTEQSRADFYAAYYYDVIEAIPQMARFMPKPKY